MIALVRPVLGFATRLYERELARRNERFDAGVGVTTLDRPVISVGNLSVGGTGKTPMVRRIVGWLRDADRRPAIAMRGYGSTAGTPSDEQDEYARALTDVPIVAQPNRTEGLIGLFSTDVGERVDIVVLDDGFQHRRLARQLDLVLIDASADTLDGACLPLGRNREPIENLARADAVILTHAERVDAASIESQSARLERITGKPPIAVCRHAWQGFDADDEALRTEAGIASGRVLGVCAIGRPEAFFEQARSALGAGLVGEVALRDHDPYRPRTIARIRRAISEHGADAVLTTNKDWSKLRRLGKDGGLGVPVVRPRLMHAFVRGEEALRELVLAVHLPDA